MNVGHRMSTGLHSLGKSIRSKSPLANEEEDEEDEGGEEPKLSDQNKIQNKIERADTKTNALRAAIMQTQLTDHGEGAIQFTRGSLVSKAQVSEEECLARFCVCL